MTAMPSRALNRQELLRQATQAEQVATVEMGTTKVAPEEVLILDVRGDLTPAQMVEEKLMALLYTGHGVSTQATEGPADVGGTRGAARQTLSRAHAEAPVSRVSG